MINVPINLMVNIYDYNTFLTEKVDEEESVEHHLYVLKKIDIVIFQRR